MFDFDLNAIFVIFIFLAMVLGFLLAYSLFAKPNKNRFSEFKKNWEISKAKLKEKSIYLEENWNKSKQDNLELRKRRLIQTEKITKLIAKVSALEQMTTIVPKLEKEIQRQVILRKRETQNNINLEKQNSELTALLENEKKQMSEKKAFLNNARNYMLNEFKVMLGSAFREEGSRFANQNKNQINSILNPLKEQLGEFKKRVDDVYDKESRDRSILLNEVNKLKTLNENISRDAINLTKALKGDIRTQGCWGELVLERVLEFSGLQKGYSYDVQLQLKQPNGDKYKPDAIVRLPEGRDIIIDSKVSLKDYEICCSSNNISDRKDALKKHVASLKAHIKRLSSKRYENLVGIRSLDFVLMFIPIEEAFSIAIKEETSLLSDAFKNNVFIVCPSTLLITLRTINNIWRDAEQNRNSAEIARQAGEMYDKFTTFTAAIDDIGKKLEKANSSYVLATKRLVSGKGNLIGRAKKLKSLGLKTKKSFPESILKNEELNSFKDSEIN